MPSTLRTVITGTTSPSASFFNSRCATVTGALVAHCSPLDPLNDDLLQDIEGAGIPVIHIQHFRRQLPDEDYILPHYEHAGYMGAVRLMMAGYDRVFLMGTMVSAPHFRLIERGFATAMEDHRDGYDREKHMFDVKPGLGTKPEVERSVRKFAGCFARSTGLLCVGSGIGDLVGPIYGEMGLEMPEELGLLGVSLVGAEDETTDTLEFDRRDILHRVVAAATRRPFESIKELVRPRKVLRGTVRETGHAD